MFFLDKKSRRAFLCSLLYCYIAYSAIAYLAINRVNFEPKLVALKVFRWIGIWGPLDEMYSELLAIIAAIVTGIYITICAQIVRSSWFGKRGDEVLAIPAFNALVAGRFLRVVGMALPGFLLFFIVLIVNSSWAGVGIAMVFYSVYSSAIFTTLIAVLYRTLTDWDTEYPSQSEKLVLWPGILTIIIMCSALYMDCFAFLLAIPAPIFCRWFLAVLEDSSKELGTQ